MVIWSFHVIVNLSMNNGMKRSWSLWSPFFLYFALIGQFNRGKSSVSLKNVKIRNQIDEEQSVFDETNSS